MEGDWLEWCDVIGVYRSIFTVQECHVNQFIVFRSVRSRENRSPGRRAMFAVLHKLNRRGGVMTHCDRQTGWIEDQSMIICCQWLAS